MPAREWFAVGTMSNNSYKENKLKKLLVLLLSVTVAAGAFAEGQTEMAAGEPITITHMTEHCHVWPETSTDLLDEMNAILGVNWVHIPCSGQGGISYRDKLRVLFGANDLPDLFETYWFEQLIQQGTSDLSIEEVAEYMPSYYGGLSAFAAGAGLDLDFTLERYKRDGVLKHYPMVWKHANYGHGYLWRQDYLDELGMDVPHTMEEWEAVFAAYKAAYPDRYSYGTRYRDTEYYRSFNAVMNAFGLSNNRFIKKGDKLVYSQGQPEMIQALEILARWYAEGYLDPEFVTVNGESEPFDAGVAIMKGWEHPSWPFDHESFKPTLKEHSPDATFAYTGPPRVEGYFPVTYAWHPMHGNGHGIGVQNNDDRDRVHAIMQRRGTAQHARWRVPDSLRHRGHALERRGEQPPGLDGGVRGFRGPGRRWASASTRAAPPWATGRSTTSRVTPSSRIRDSERVGAAGSLRPGLRPGSEQRVHADAVLRQRARRGRQRPARRQSGLPERVGGAVRSDHHRPEAGVRLSGLARPLERRARPGDRGSGDRHVGPPRIGVPLTVTLPSDD